MLSVIFGVVILMAVPEYAAAQRRERPERSETGRTAQPREGAVQAAPARRSDRSPEPRGETPTRRRERPGDNDEPSRTDRADRERGTRPRAERNPAGRGASTITQPEHARSPFPGRQHRPGERDTDYRPHYRGSQSRRHVVFVPYAAPVIVEREVIVERQVVDEAPRVIVEQPSPARLILDVFPPTAQVFADGYFIGIPEDFRVEAGGAVLEPGPHRIDILARGYEKVSFDVNLARGQSATFRHALTPIGRESQPAPDTGGKAAPVAAPPTTFYLIPGCYMGNVPPKDANLPATCDIARAVTVQY